MSYIIMSEYTQECIKLHHFLHSYLGKHATNPLTMYYNTSYFLKNTPIIPPSHVSSWIYALVPE